STTLTNTTAAYGRRSGTNDFSRTERETPGPATSVARAVADQRTSSSSSRRRGLLRVNCARPTWSARPGAGNPKLRCQRRYTWPQSGSEKPASCLSSLVTSTAGEPATRDETLSMKLLASRLEQFDWVAGRIVEKDLRPTRPGHDVVAEMDPG